MWKVTRLVTLKLNSTTMNSTKTTSSYATAASVANYVLDTPAVTVPKTTVKQQRPDKNAKCTVCTATGHSSEQCRTRCRLCWAKGQHLTQKCDADMDQVECPYCKEIGHITQNCHLAQAKSVADWLEVLGFCADCGLYGHDCKKHGCTAPSCASCGSIEHHTKQCYQCPECLEWNPDHRHDQVNTIYPEEDEDVRSAKKVHGCPYAPICRGYLLEDTKKGPSKKKDFLPCVKVSKGTTVRHSRRNCPKRTCSFCGDRGHSQGYKCPMKHRDINYQEYIKRKYPNQN